MCYIKITFREFIKNYCGNIRESLHSIKQRKRNNIFSYDEIIMDDENNPIMIIYDSDGGEININDIFQMDEKEFGTKYKTKASVKAYTSYRNAYIIKEGRELMETILQEVEEEKKRYKRDSLDISILDL